MENKTTIEVEKPMKINNAIQLESKYLMHTYKRSAILLQHGNGMYVTDSTGKQYLDFIGGIATCLIGHGNTGFAKAISKQASALVNTTNLYYTEPQLLLAEKLCKLSGGERVFFSNSGTEANEAAFKLARLCTKKTKIISVQGGFHGRTFASLSATYSEKYRQPFEPLVPGFQIVEDNLESIEKAIDADTAAVIIECIQGESGVKMHSEEYLKQLRKLTAEKNTLLIVDEVQTGNGRTGKFFAFQHAGIKPDIVTLAKGLGNGVPIGATIAFGGLNFSPGLHGSTFGGNALTCSAANFTIDYVLANNFMQNAAAMGEYFMAQLEQLKLNSTRIKEIRGKGLIVGAELNCDGAEIVTKCEEKGLLVNCAAKTTLRFLPSLIVTKAEIDKCTEILSEVLAK